MFLKIQPDLLKKKLKESRKSLISVDTDFESFDTILNVEATMKQQGQQVWESQVWSSSSIEII